MDTDNDWPTLNAATTTPMDIQGTTPNPTTPHIVLALEQPGADSTAGTSKRTATAMESTDDGHSPPKLVDKATIWTPPLEPKQAQVTPASTLVQHLVRGNLWVLTPQIRC
jgi:hypothetical protein